MDYRSNKGIRKEEFGLETRKSVNKTRFREDDGVKMVNGFVEEGFGCEMVLSQRRASHRLIKCDEFGYNRCLVCCHFG